MKITISIEDKEGGVSVVTDPPASALAKLIFTGSNEPSLDYAMTCITACRILSNKQGELNNIDTDTV